jgi:hypothetical protein
VPNAWLRCLLWDVPEKRRQQVIDDLCDRSLVKVDDDGYYLHPVIAAEAIERLKSIDKSRRDYLRLIKEQIDLLVAPVQTIQDSLAGINKKFSLATKRYKKAAFRALYIEYIISEFDFDNCQTTEKEESKYFELAYLIDKNFEVFKLFQNLREKLINNLHYCRMVIIQEVNHIIKLDVISLERGVEKLLKKAIKNRAKQLYEAWEETPISFIKDVEIIADIAFEFIVHLNSEEEGINLFNKNGTLNSERQKFINNTKQIFYQEIIKGGFSRKVFRASFVNVLVGKKVKQIEVKRNQLEVDRWYFIKCCKYSLEFKFSDEQKKLLQQYYDMNLLLVRCLDSASDTVRSHIEDELLLPIAEIEARRRLRD